MKNPLKSLLAVTTCLSMGAVLPAAAGEFDGMTVEAKLIGGQQYEGLYGRIGAVSYTHLTLPTIYSV